MPILIYINDWGIGTTTEPHPRAYLEYQGMDSSIHNKHDVRLYVDGNFGTIKDKIEYLTVVAGMLIRGEE